MFRRRRGQRGRRGRRGAGGRVRALGARDGRPRRGDEADDAVAAEDERRHRRGRRGRRGRRDRDGRRWRHGCRGPADRAVRPRGPPDDELVRLDLGSLRVPGLEGLDINVKSTSPPGPSSGSPSWTRASALQLRLFAAPRNRGHLGRGPRARSPRRSPRTAAWPTSRRPPTAARCAPGSRSPSRTGRRRRPAGALRRDRRPAVAAARGAVRPGRRRPRVAGRLLTVYRGTVVVRGSDPFAPREPLPLRLPDRARPRCSPEGAGPSRSTSSGDRPADHRDPLSARGGGPPGVSLDVMSTSRSPLRRMRRPPDLHQRGARGPGPASTRASTAARSRSRDCRSGEQVDRLRHHPGPHPAARRRGPALEAELYDGSGTVISSSGSAAAASRASTRVASLSVHGRVTSAAGGRRRSSTPRTSCTRDRASPPQTRRRAAETERPRRDRVADLVEECELREAVGGMRGVIDSGLATTVFLLVYAVDGRRSGPGAVGGAGRRPWCSLVVRLVRQRAGAAGALRGARRRRSAPSSRAATGRAANFYLVGILLQAAYARRLPRLARRRAGRCSASWSARCSARASAGTTTRRAAGRTGGRAAIWFVRVRDPARRPVPLYLHDHGRSRSGSAKLACWAGRCSRSRRLLSWLVLRRVPPRAGGRRRRGAMPRPTRPSRRAVAATRRRPGAG